MKESDVRSGIESFLRLTLRRAVWPIGLGVAMTACSSATPLYAAPLPDAGFDAPADVPREVGALDAPADAPREVGGLDAPSDLPGEAAVPDAGDLHPQPLYASVVPRGPDGMKPARDRSRTRRT